MEHMTRLQPSKPVKAGKAILGGEKPLICIPLVGKTSEEIMKEAQNVPAIAPDIIELRVDAWNFIEDVNVSVEMIKKVRETVGDTPIILTCRGDWEGGFKKVSDDAKFAVYKGAAKAGLVNFIDMELKYGEDKIAEMLKFLKGKNVSLIVSFHDFKQTPSKSEIVSIMEAEITAGADVAKLAAMPEKEEDVLALLEATLAVRRSHPDIPMITMSMGPVGAVSRIVGGMFGSDLTFAVGSKASAPGQIPVKDLEKCFSIVHP